MPSRLLVLVLDAVETTLVTRWVAEGKLPVLGSAIKLGTSGPVQGVEGLYVGSTSASFSTGLDPAGHGFYRPTQILSGTYEFFPPLETPGGLGGTPIWKVASDAGGRVAALDVPLVPLDRSLNGIQIVDWTGEGHMPFQTTPGILEREIDERYGEYPLNGFDRPRRKVKEFERLVADLERGIEVKTELTLDLLDREDWTLFVQVFLEGHCIGHQCWHVHDPAHPAHEPEVASILGDPIERVYRALDRAVGVILERAGDAQVLLLSLHGMAGYRGAALLLRESLYRLGVTGRPAPRQSRRLHDALYRLGITDNRAYRSLRERIASPSAWEPRDVSGWADVGASRCFTLPYGSAVSAIRLNLSGREPEGVLQPGADADAFCEQLSSDLLSIVDDSTGSPAIRSVDRTDALWEGVRRDALPDLLVQWNEAILTGTTLHAGGRGSMVRLRSDAIGVVEGVNHYHRTGDHIRDGFFVCVGPGVPTAARTEPVKCTDFYPTICDLLDLPLPDVEGAVIPELAGAGRHRAPTR